MFHGFVVEFFLVSHRMIQTVDTAPHGTYVDVRTTSDVGVCATSPYGRTDVCTRAGKHLMYLYVFRENLEFLDHIKRRTYLYLLPYGTAQSTGITVLYT